MTIQAAVNAAKNEPDFHLRVEYYLVKAAIAITTEATNTPLHAERLALAKLILASEGSHTGRFALAVVTNATVLAAANHAAVPDGDIEFVVNSIYNSFIA